MNVLAVVPLYPPSSMVGAWITTDLFLQHLAARGHQVDVLTRYGQEDPYGYGDVTVWPWTREAVELFDGVDVVVRHSGDDGWAVTVA